MKLSLKNIGILKEADVLLDGLTVIAGENDTGKSTVGKVMFAMVKGFNQFEKEALIQKERSIEGALTSLYISVRQTFNLQEHPTLYTDFNVSFFKEELQTFINTDAKEKNEKFIEEIEKLFKKKLEILNAAIENRFNNPESKKNWRVNFTQQLNLIKEFIFFENKENAIKLALAKNLNSEFSHEISPKNSDLESEIKVSENNNLIFKIVLQNDQIKIYAQFDEILSIDNVTFVETPIHLQMNDVISYAVTIGEEGALDRPRVALHVKDLMNKLKQSQYYFEKPDIEPFMGKIGEIVAGTFAYDSLKQDFVFQKKNGESFSVRSVNTASGIKSFGIIQLLLQANVLNERSLLIIDEPETHLHPKWQVKYAELMVELVKNNVSVLIASHSPYMIQALKVFSEKEQIEEKTNFYLSEKLEDGFATIHHVNHDMNALFSKLSQPLQNLIWQ